MAFKELRNGEADIEIVALDVVRTNPSHSCIGICKDVLPIIVEISSV